MDPAYFTILGVVTVGVAYSVLRKPSHTIQSSSGWIGFGIIAMLILGLVVSGNLGNEFLAWIFGLALMVAMPAMFFLSIGSAIGRLFLRSRTKEEKTK